MKLPEKILYYRKKAGLSQEALAEQIGISRQAISKWETGEAVPEINKLVSLAKVFNVSVDHLLSEDDLNKQPLESEEFVRSANWIDALPKTIGRLLKRYGWLFGVYLAVIGVGFTAIGTLAKVMVKNMFGYSLEIEPMFADIITNNPVSIMGSFIIMLGVVMMIAGVVLALVLKRRSAD